MIRSRFLPPIPRRQPAWKPWRQGGTRFPWGSFLWIKQNERFSWEKVLWFSTEPNTIKLFLRQMWSGENLISAFSGKVARRARSSSSISSTRAWGEEACSASTTFWSCWKLFIWKSPQQLGWSWHWWRPRSARVPLQGRVQGRCTWWWRSCCGWWWRCGDRDSGGGERLWGDGQHEATWARWKSTLLHIGKDESVLNGSDLKLQGY